MYAFLSDDWVQEARRIRSEYETRSPAPPLAVRLNIVFTGSPSDPDRIDAHLDTTSGTVDVEIGHLAEPDVTVTVDYETARTLFVGADPQAAMAAFLGGRIKVDGDIAKLLAFQATGAVDPVVGEVFGRLRAVTA